MAASPPHLLQAPHLTSLAQSRPRLALAGGSGTTEVWASAGAGKTTLLAQWAADLSAAGETAAWISLPAAGTLRHRLAALTRDSIAVNEILSDSREGRSGGRLTLLFDDIHHLHETTEGQWLAKLIAFRPRGVRIVLAGRHPPKALADILPRSGSATEPEARSGFDAGSVQYRTADLAFTRPETAAFLAARGIHLEPPDVDAIQRRTGGWAAALTLLSGLVPVNGNADGNGVGHAYGNGHSSGRSTERGTKTRPPEAALAPLDFEPGQQAAADYLVTEILDLLPGTYLSFLLTLCVADAVTEPVAVQLTHRADAGRILDHLDLQTGLLSRSGTPGKPPAYVFHPVLLSYLRTEFRRQDLAAYTRTLGASPGDGTPGSAGGRLTPKEREILRELPRYQTVRDIAERQRLSPNTVKTHMRALYQKLGVSNRAAAVQKAVERGLL